jgi:hypothetical protein
MIDDLEEMCKVSCATPLEAVATDKYTNLSQEGLTKWHGYRAAVEKNNQKPARLFFYRGIINLKMPNIC